ncbi:hypothetical protein AgCh_003795 [Apium graveolens]
MEYITNFLRAEGNSDCGYIFDGILEILRFNMLGVCKGRYVEENREEVIVCSVCFENLTTGMMFGALPCYHMFHSICIDRWLKRVGVCPNCRYSLDDVKDVEDMLTELLSLNVHKKNSEYLSKHAG